MHFPFNRCGERQRWFAGVDTARERTCLHVPHAHGLVHAATRTHDAERVPRDAKDGAQVTPEHACARLVRARTFGLGREVGRIERPEPDGHVVACRSEHGRVCREGDVRYACRVRREGTLQRVRLGLVDMDDRLGRWFVSSVSALLDHGRRRKRATNKQQRAICRLEKRRRSK